MLPRKRGDWANNDDIYPEIDQKEKELGRDMNQSPKGVDNEDRVARTQEDMAKEAEQLRSYFEQFEDIWGRS